jgi:lysozyme
MLEGVDVSYAQGNYRPGSEAFVIVNASRANIGLAVGSQYHNQVANARAAGKHVGHYFFNGNVDPVRCANYFCDNLSYQDGDSLWLDVEAEGSTGTPAWNPSQALAFLNQVKARIGVVPGVYLNRSLMDGFNWSAVVAAGAPLWIAYYNPAPPPIRWWPTWTVWQYTSTPIDRNKAQGPMVAALNAEVIQEDEEEDMDGFYIQVSSAGAKYYFSPAKGKARPVSSAEWSFLRAVEGTAGGLKALGRPLPVINVSQGWLDNATKL